MDFEYLAYTVLCIFAFIAVIYFWNTPSFLKKEKVRHEKNMSIVSYNKASLSYFNLAYLCIMYVYCLSVRFKRTKYSSGASFLPYLAFSCRSSYSGVFKKKD